MLDLLRGSDSSPSTSAARPRLLLAISACVHALVIGGALVLSLSAPGFLPTPRQALARVLTERYEHLIDVELPTPPRTAGSPERGISSTNHDVTSQSAADDSLAPITAPIGIVDDTGHVSDVVVRRPSGLLEIEGGSGPGFGIARIETLPTPPTVVPVRLHSGILAPVKTTNAEPVYPSIAQRARVQGVVVLEAVVDTSGAVKELRVLRSIPLLDAAALAAVRQWRYSPARLNGEPVPVIMTITVNFTL